MKNIHVIPTDKPSRLFYYNSHLGLARHIVKKNDGVNTQHIYITSDEEIKPSDYYLWKGKEIIKANDIEISFHPTVIIDCKRIILTTDQDLIKDGVQAISEEFLEWFVKNPSCEEVEVEKMFNVIQFTSREFIYKIIIPKEEQKQHLIDMMQDDEKLGLYDKPKQTAVEWLEKQLDILDAYKIKVKTIIEYAKEMEKKQIIDAYKAAEDKWEVFQYEHRYGREYLTVEQYYNETYDKSRED